MASSSRIWLRISGIIVFFLFLIAASSPFIKHVKINFLPTHLSDKSSFKASKHNVWTDLSEDEAGAIINFLLKTPSLNLTDSAKATGDDNAILLVELLQPNKSDVLSYLAGSSGAPARWARAVIEQRTTDEAHTANYMVC